MSQSTIYGLTDDEEYNYKKYKDDAVQNASALFGSKSDPIGDLRTDVRTTNRNAHDQVDKYVRTAAVEAKKLRVAIVKISKLQQKGQKALDMIKKDKSLGEDAKKAQADQFSSLSVEIASATESLKDQERWMNRLLGQRVVQSTGSTGKSSTKIDY